MTSSLSHFLQPIQLYSYSCLLHQTSFSITPRSDLLISAMSNSKLFLQPFSPSLNSSFSSQISHLTSYHSLTLTRLRADLCNPSFSNPTLEISIPSSALPFHRH
jgi:hypothetical protein